MKKSSLALLMVITIIIISGCYETSSNKNVINNQVRSYQRIDLFISENPLIKNIYYEISGFIDSLDCNKASRKLRNIVRVDIIDSLDNIYINMQSLYFYTYEHEAYFVYKGHYLITISGLKLLSFNTPTKGKIPKKFKSANEIKPAPFWSAYRLYIIHDNGCLSLVQSGML